MTRYLLRTDSEIASFRRKYATAVVKYRDRYRDWILNLPVWEWSPLRIDASSAPFVIGLICLLYIDGEVNITFSSSMKAIMRNPLTHEEAEYQIRKIFSKPKKETKNGKNHA